MGPIQNEIGGFQISCIIAVEFRLAATDGNIAIRRAPYSPSTMQALRWTAFLAKTSASWYSGER